METAEVLKRREFAETERSQLVEISTRLVGLELVVWEPKLVVEEAAVVEPEEAVAVEPVEVAEEPIAVEAAEEPVVEETMVEEL